jgi:glycosyltransferase involved in cell wall biosynthesis
VFVDGAVRRRPATGTARWLHGLVGALEDVGGLDTGLSGTPRLITRLGKLHRLPNLALERWWYDIEFPRLADRFRADVMLMPANLSARKGGRPQVVTILDVNFLSQPGTYERTFVRYATWAYRRSARDADAITTISAFSRQEIAQHLGIDPGRIEVVYPGLDTPVAIHHPRPRPHPRPYALCVTATERHKNVGMLLDAWSQGSPAGLDLVIVGQPGREHTALLKRAALTRDRVRMTGRVDGTELEAWYEHAAVFVFPSRMEGFGYPPLEAMLRGVPVISSRAGSLGEVLGDGASLVDPDDADGLRGHVIRLVDDADHRARQVVRGADVAATYTWPRAAREMTHLLRSVAAG